MNTAIGFFLLAVQCLTAVINTPTLRPDIRDSFINIANIAIVQGQDALANASTSPIITDATVAPIIAPQLTQIQFGSPMTDSSQITVEQLSSPQLAARDPQNGIPFGVIAFRVRVLNSSGDTVDKAPVTLTVGNETMERVIDTVHSPETKNDHYTDIQYTPQHAGQIEFDFTSGALQKAVVVTVQ